MTATPAETAAGVRAHALRLRVRDGFVIATTPQISSHTTYVLLEQEAWFEKEGDFLRAFIQPGMAAIDIGANHGVYSLLLAQLVGPGGRVVAYEPGGETRAFLEFSRELNGFEQLEVVGAALSDGERQGFLGFAQSSELRALGEGGEPVRITSLDAETAAGRWTAPDFIKIDAEGEEEKILAGGRRLFADASPLVMFELRAGNTLNLRLLDLFRAAGYGLFRQLVGAPILVPAEVGEALDGFELNLFAAKPDRAASLAKAGLVAPVVPSWKSSDDARRFALRHWRDQPFAAATPIAGIKGLKVEPAYLDALAGYAVWRRPDLAVAVRVGALRFALTRLRSLCAGDASPERLSTWARVAADWGARSESLDVIRRTLTTVNRVGIGFVEPFWPASAVFDVIGPGDQLRAWFDVGAIEHHERSVAFSSAYTGRSAYLDALCAHPLATTEMERRRTLIDARDGKKPTIPARLLEPAADHLNADAWRRLAAGNL